ncbi:MAG: hypothetical protein U0792_18345 [Gemmataceae bacterium]
MIPEWQLPPGVDRGLWDYLHADDMVAGYDEQMRPPAWTGRERAPWLWKLGRSGAVLAGLRPPHSRCVGVDLDRC